MTRYESAKEIYSRYGIDTDEAIKICKEIPISLHCWQGDDVKGFDHDGGLSGGIQTTGSPELERLMEGRQIYQHQRGTERIPLCAEDGRHFVCTAAPILSEGDVLGCVLFTGSDESKMGGEVNYKLVQSVAGFLGRHMES